MQHRETEQILEQFMGGVHYKYESSIPLSEIHIADSNRHNIRPGGLDEERVEQYAIAMQDGAEFPAIVLYRGRKGYAFLGGMHRIEAAKRAGKDSLDAYIVDVEEGKDERTIEVLQRTLNMQHGSGYSKEERILHGVRLMALGYDSKEVGRMVMVPESTLRAKQDVAKARIRATGLGLKLLPDVNLLEMSRIRNDDIFKSAVELVHKARLDGQRVKDLSRAVREQTTEKGQTEVIDQWTTNLASTIKATRGGKLRVPTTDAQKAINALVSISSLSPKVLKHATNYERETMINQIKLTVQALQRTLALIVAEVPREVKKRA